MPRQYQHEGFVEQRMALEPIVVLEPVVGDDDIDVTGQQRMAVQVGEPGGQGVIAGMTLDRLDQRLANRGGQRIHQRDAHLMKLLEGAAAQFAPRCAGLAEHALGSVIEEAPRGGRLQRPGVAQKQRHPQRFLEIGQALRDRRLLESQVQRRRRLAAPLQGLDEDFHAAQIEAECPTHIATSLAGR